MRARTRDARRRTIHPAVAAAIGAALVVAAPLAGATTASAHSALVSSDPAPGDELDASPEQITLTFNEDVLDMGAAVFIVDEAGVDHAGEPVVEGPTVTVPLASPMPGGAAEVRWRVVSGDGHPISDVIAFEVAGAPPTASAEPSEASAAPVAEPEPQATDEADAEASAEAELTSDGVPRTLLVGVAGAAAALVVLAIVLGARRARRAAADRAARG